MKRAVAAGTALLLALLLIILWPDRAHPPGSPPRVAPTQPAAIPKPNCTRGVRGPFTPDRIAIAGVAKGATVLALPRDASDVPGVPPLSTAGKAEFAWDRPPGLMPGGKRGNVLLNAHTWPDGSALGNRLLAELHVGGIIKVTGRDGQRLCYRVNDRIVVSATQGSDRYYARRGKPQLALLVCSGPRLGPGHWANRTIWFATPISS